MDYFFFRICYTNGGLRWSKYKSLAARKTWTEVDVNQVLLDAEVCALDPLSHSRSCQDIAFLHVRGCGVTQACHLSLEGAGKKLEDYDRCLCI